MNHTLPGMKAADIARHRLLTNHLGEQQEKTSVMVIRAAIRERSEPTANIRVWFDFSRPQRLHSVTKDKLFSIKQAAL